MNELELVKKCKKGDKKSFAALIKLYEKDLYRVSIAITKDEYDALDCIQETILQAFQSIDKLNHEEYFKTWIIKILINKCNGLLNKKKRLIAIADNFNEGTYYDNTDIIDLKEAVKKLEDELRVLVVLYYFEDLNIKDISESLGIPEGTVKSRLSRAREKLKSSLEIKESEVMQLEQLYR